ncbi:hypothetical protein [Lederbergia citrea]|uniref:hypothetical protein n=1 Tax=Lederbergia citrea TaxID=2833581 RepID=UPI001BC949CC|nr:hypothetical protein [Lederbergia citrea]MBS4205677.1 hypothetical protein [Lederbergia citrea]
MIKVKVKLKDKPAFTVPLPYLLLRTGGWIVSSRPFWKLINSKVVKEHLDENEKSWIPGSIDRRDIKELLKTIRQYKGLKIVEVKDKDGTEVVVKL